MPMRNFSLAAGSPQMTHSPFLRRAIIQRYWRVRTGLSMNQYR